MPYSNFERIARRKQQTRLHFDSVNSSLTPASSEDLGHEFNKEKNKPIPSSGTRVIQEINEERKCDSIEKPDKIESQLSSISPRASANALWLKYKATQLEAGEPKERVNEKSLDKNQEKLKNQEFPMVRSACKKYYRMNLSLGVDSSEGSEAEDDHPTNNGAVRKWRSAQIVDLCSESEDNSIAPSISGKNKNNSANHYKNPSSTPDVNHKMSLPNHESTEDELDLLSSKRAKKLSSPPKTSDLKGKKALNKSHDPFLSNTSPTSSHQKTISSSIQVDSEDDVRSSPLKRRRKYTIEDDSDCDTLLSPLKRCCPKIASPGTDESEELVSPASRRHLRKKKDEQVNSVDSDQPRVLNRQISPKRITRQSKIKKRRTEKEKALELIRRKRAGEKINKVSSSESYEEDSDEDLLILSEFEDDESQPEKENWTKDQGRAEIQASDSDFIVDDEGPLGVPDYSAQIPLQFTHAAHKPLKEHFRDAIEWMVKKKVSPGFPHDDEIYLQAFRKLNDMCEGLAKSKFMSTQWTPSFTAAILARPYLISGPLEAEEGYDATTGVPKCDACNHRKHIPTSYLQLKGKVYDKNSLDQIDQIYDSEQEDSDIAGARSENSRDQKILPQSKKWFAGSTCKANAQYAHSLIHWKFSLNEWVVNTLTLEGHLSPNKIAERKRMTREETNEFGNQLVDAWNTKGTIRLLYRDWKIQRITAVEYKERVSDDWN